jgi:hypothetical protein
MTFTQMNEDTEGFHARFSDFLRSPGNFPVCDDEYDRPTGTTDSAKAMTMTGISAANE